MQAPPLSADEPARLGVVQALQLRPGEADPALGAIARLASRQTGCRIGAISVVDLEQQWFLASTDAPLPEVPRASSLCAHAILEDEGLVIPDAKLDARFAGNPLFALEPPVAFYAGMPFTVDGRRVGCVCVMDERPRSLANDQLDALRDLASLCGALLAGRLRETRSPSREAEDALRDRQASEWLSRAKSEFLSRVNHEMRTPLNAVIGFTQLLRLSPDGGGPDKVAQYTEHVLRASEQMLAMINDLVDLQRIDDGRLALQLRPLALSGPLGSALEVLEPLAQRHGVVLQGPLDDGSWVLADAQRLRQVLVNIVSNAIKYNRTGGWVCVSMLPGDARRLAIAIEDTGSGLTQQQLARLFQPFERLGHESTDIEGSGLGLVIARRLVEEMGGELTLSSVPAGGTLVRIDLPRAEAAAAEVAPSASPPPTLRMLYVEDNRINAILFEEALRMRGGIELQVAEDGAEALALVRYWQPDVLVLDANLPDMNGYEVLARLREVPELARTPAFMCSADAMDEDVQRAAQAGFAGYWTKPIDIGRVMQDLDRLLEQRTSR